MTAYLEDFGRSKLLKSWQFTQHIRVLEILYKGFLAISWAKSFSWQYWKDAARALDTAHPTIAMEANPVELPTSKNDTFSGATVKLIKPYSKFGYGDL